MVRIALFILLAASAAFGQITVQVRSDSVWGPTFAVTGGGGGYASGRAASQFVVTRIDPAGNVTTPTLSSGNFRETSKGIYQLKDVYADSGTYVYQLTDSITRAVVVTADNAAPFQEVVCSTKVGYSLQGRLGCFVSGKANGFCLRVAKHINSTSTRDTIGFAEGFENVVQPYLATPTCSLKANDSIQFVAFQLRSTVSALKATSGGSSTDTINIKLAIGKQLSDSLRKVAGDSIYAEALRAARQALGDSLRKALGDSACTAFQAAQYVWTDWDGGLRVIDTARHVYVTDSTWNTVNITPPGVQAVWSYTGVGGRKLCLSGGTGEWIGYGGDSTHTSGGPSAATIWGYATRTLTNWNADSARVIAGDSCSSVTINYDSIAVYVADTLRLAHGAGAWGPGVGGSNVLSLRVLRTSDSVQVPNAIASAWSLDYGTQYSYDATNSTGLAVFSVPDTFALQVEQVGYTSYFDTLYLTGATTDTAFIAPISIPSPASPARCNVWGVVSGLDTASAARCQVTAYLSKTSLPQWADSVSVSTDKVTATPVLTSGQWIWTMPLLRGMKVTIEIPKNAVRISGTVPNAVTARDRTFAN